MSYTKKNWALGDIITPEALNNMENGIEAAETAATTLELPAYTAEDVGKVLTVQADGTVAWVLPEEPTNGEE